MSSFFNQVGQLSSNLGHSLGNSVGHAFQQGLHQAAPEELRIGSHSIVVKEKIAEGMIYFTYIDTISMLTYLSISISQADLD
jgi:hypothetical protein